MDCRYQHSAELTNDSHYHQTKNGHIQRRFQFVSAYLFGDYCQEVCLQWATCTMWICCVGANKQANGNI